MRESFRAKVASSFSLSRKTSSSSRPRHRFSRNPFPLIKIPHSPLSPPSLQSHIARYVFLMEAANAAVSKTEALEREIQRLKNLVEERESRVTFLERETKSLKQLNAESEMKVRDLERKLSVVEVRESEERSKRVRAEEERREKVGEKEREIEEMKERMEELEKMREKGERVDGEWKKGLGLVMAAGSGAVAAVFYFCFRKRIR